MPCYLFTYHAYGSWMPDRKQGYVKRSRGMLELDREMAANYRRAMKESPVQFTDEVQLAIVDAVIDSRPKQNFEVYFIATDSTHAHLLVSWRDDRPWLRMRSGIKSSLSRRLNTQFGQREWFAEGGSRKGVKDRKHFDYLATAYLPRHAGWKWSPERGKFR